jgi:hypothetical protein
MKHNLLGIALASLGIAACVATATPWHISASGMGTPDFPPGPTRAAPILSARDFPPGPTRAAYILNAPDFPPGPTLVNRA